MSWISVKSKLPPNKCLFLLEDGTMAVGEKFKGDSYYTVGGWESCCYCGGTSQITIDEKLNSQKVALFWMPLPEPPRE